MNFGLTTRRSTAATLEPPLPAAGRYDIDPTHSSIEFVARHLVAAKVRGRFTGFEGTIEIGADLAGSAVQVSIDTDSVDTGVADRDEHLRSPDFFDVADHPNASFRSTGVEASSSGHSVHGALTIAGVTRPVDLALEYHGEVTDPWGNPRLVFSATAEINREDFGLTWNQPLETGGLLVGKSITIEIEVQAVRRDG